MKKQMWKKTIAGLLAAACLLSLGAPALAAGEDAGVTAGLAGYWTFDGDTQADRLENQAAESTITAAPAGTAAAQADGGIHGGGVYFDGADNSPLKLNLTDAGQGLNAKTTDFTLAAWVKYDADMDSSYNSNLFQLTGAGRTILYVAPNGKYVTYLTADEVAMSATAPVGGRWHHVALTWDHSAKTMTCYINGTQEVSATLTGDPADAATDVWIGTHKSNAHQAIKGYVDELRYYTRALSDEDVTALYTYESYHEIAEAAAELHVTVDADTVLREITPAMFGINHRYHKNGYGTWDAEAKKVNADFNSMVKEGGYGSVRWPGGTVSNLFTWKDSIGPLAERTPTIAGNNFYSDAGEAPVEPGFGLDEAAKWICDDLGVEMIYVYGMGRGSAQDAADLVEYLNAPNDGTNPGGGTDWAAVRADNGHPDPYNVTKFEIGNEFTDVGQNYWATPKGGSNDAQAVEDYIMGGRRNFAGETQYYQHNDRVVKKGDWRKDASFSDGEANEERYLCYVPVIANTATIYVNGAEWTIVDTLAGQAADAEVCTLDYETGKITFGDGTNGKIPPAGEQITAHYSSDRDGFAAYSDAMKAIASEIGMEIKIYSGVHDSLQSSFITKMHEKGYDSKYDGVIYHPYGGSYTEATYDSALTQARSFAATIGTLKNQMDTTTNTTNKEVAVSEFGLNASVDFTKSLGNAIYAANFMIDCVNRGAAYLNRHCLVDFTVGDNLGAWQQAVIQCLGSASSDVSENEYISTPSARMFSIFNLMTGSTQVDYTATGNDNYATGNGQTVQKVNLYATKDTDGNVYVLVVNNQKSNTEKLHLALQDADLTGREIEVWSLTSESVMDENTQGDPDKVAVQKSQVTAEEETLTYTLPAHSITSFKIPPSAPAVVDKTALETAYNAVKDAEQGNYTDASWNTLQTAIAEAKEVLENVDATQEEVDAAIKALTDAQEGLEVTPVTPVTPSTPSNPAVPVISNKPNEDGTFTAIETKPDGTVTETTKKPDGTVEVVETKPDGTVTETTTQPDGAKVEKVTDPEENVTITATDAEGEVLAEVVIPAVIPETAKRFEDVPEGHWADEAIHQLAAIEVVNGVTDTTYSPVAPMKRGDLAVVLHRLSNGKTGLTDTFADVERGKYYADGIAWAAKVGVVEGFSEEEFQPETVITREQLALMLYRYAKLLGMDTGADAAVLEPFADSSATHAWAQSGMAWCVKSGIIQGRDENTLAPTSNVTRAEVAVMLQRFCEGSK